MNNANNNSAKPMSFSAPRMAIENPQAKRIGRRTFGGTIWRRPIRCVGVERSSRFAAKYEAKKKTNRILAISTGWKEIDPTETRRPPTPRAKRIGRRTFGGTIWRRPIRCVGVERSSRFAAKYEAKKKTNRILAISTGWKEIDPTETQ